MRRFDKVLIANRHEIARRVVRAARAMGLETVAVFSDADADAPHVHEADEAVRIGPPPSRDSYLDIDAVLEAARTTGAQAVHPGYGFLAENAEFAQRCVDEGLVFVGPTPEAMRVAGDKARAKRLARDAHVPVLEGFEADHPASESTRRAARSLGFPLLVKARAGGGGKGMRVVRDSGGLEAALESASREAESAFGDANLIVERYVESPRHVEVQILADAHGNVVHLFDRDCSVQRRHQKVIEEAPAPALDDALRKRMTDAAVAMARAVDYRGAGTVEFLVDGDDFFFLEINARLQVEHPVTEAITGIDLVRAQLEIAQGLPLPFTQDDSTQSDITATGHAIEARLNAEDPARDFLPSTGTVHLWSVPDLPGLRIDSGIDDLGRAHGGLVVTPHYDPLLAKIIAHGHDRDEARRRLIRGLSELAVGGVATNRSMLLGALTDADFRRGGVDTGFLDNGFLGEDRAWRAEASLEDIAPLAIAATLLRIEARRLETRRRGTIPVGVPLGWRNNRWRPAEEIFAHDGGRVRVEYVARGDRRFRVAVLADSDDAEPVLDAPDHQHEVTLIAVEANSRTDTALVIEIDGVRRRYRIGQGTGQGTGRASSTLSVHGLGRCIDFAVVSRFPGPSASGVVEAGGCAAPMTGKVVRVDVQAGDPVSAGDTLIVLEAMKMEHHLVAQTDGIVESIRCEAGQMVDPDQVLVTIGSPVDPDDG